MAFLVVYYYLLAGNIQNFLLVVLIFFGSITVSARLSNGVTMVSVFGMSSCQQVTLDYYIVYVSILSSS